MNPGFTPAYAGNTEALRILGGESRVHPRIRGEYPLDIARSISRKGSPPHTRGIPEETETEDEHIRFTPAYAGNTRKISYEQRHIQVHPRIRGEYQNIYCPKAC